MQSNTSDFGALSGLLALLIVVVMVALFGLYVVLPAWAGINESLQPLYALAQ